MDNSAARSRRNGLRFLLSLIGKIKGHVLQASSLTARSVTNLLFIQAHTSDQCFSIPFANRTQLQSPIATLLLVHKCELVLMQDTSAIDGWIFAEQEWRDALLQIDHVISFLESLETTTTEENEYKKFLSEILKHAHGSLARQKESCRALESRIGLSAVEQHIKAAKSFASRFESKLADSGRRDQPDSEISAPKWHLNYDDLAELAKLSDGFCNGSIRSFSMRIEAAQK